MDTKETKRLKKLRKKQNKNQSLTKKERKELERLLDMFMSEFLNDEFMVIEKGFSGRVKPRSERLLAKLGDNTSKEFVKYVDRAIDFIQMQTLDVEFVAFVDGLFNIVPNKQMTIEDRKKLRKYINSYLQYCGDVYFKFDIKSLEALEDTQKAKRI